MSKRGDWKFNPSGSWVDLNQGFLWALSEFLLKMFEAHRGEELAEHATVMGSSLSKFRTLCDHEPLPGRAVLLRSLHVKAAGHHRPTKVGTRFMGRRKVCSSVAFYMS